MSLQFAVFHEFIEALHLECADYVLVTILADHEVNMVVFDEKDSCERIYGRF